MCKICPIQAEELKYKGEKMETNSNNVNSAINGNIIFCPKCGVKGNASYAYCQICGERLDLAKSNGLNDSSRRENSNIGQVNNEVENNNALAFAQGLPEWSLEPPQIMVRRRNG